jgi:hypothetical protein
MCASTPKTDAPLHLLRQRNPYSALLGRCRLATVAIDDDFGRRAGHAFVESNPTTGSLALLSRELREPLRHAADGGISSRIK